jgi:hypothetical protein
MLGTSCWPLNRLLVSSLDVGRLRLDSQNSLKVAEPLELLLVQRKGPKFCEVEVCAEANSLQILRAPVFFV